MKGSGYRRAKAPIGSIGGKVPETLPKLSQLTQAAKAQSGPSKAPVLSEEAKPTTVKREDRAVDITLREQQEIAAEALESEARIPEGIIDEVSFVLFSHEELEKVAVCVVSSENKTSSGSLFDPRMGSIETNVACSTCRRWAADCPGHLGRIVFNSPIYHPLFLRQLASVLSCVCHTDGKLLVSEEVLKDRGILRYSGERRLRMIEAEAGNNPCTSGSCRPNPVILLDRLKDTFAIFAKRPKCAGEGSLSESSILFKELEDDDDEGFEDETEDERRRRLFLKFKATGIKEGKPREGEFQIPIDRVQRILSLISQHDAEILGFRHGSHPIRFILRSWPVLPPNMRYPDSKGGQSTPNGLTTIYGEMIRVNNSINAKTREDARKEATDRLFYLVKHFIDNNTDPKYSIGSKKEFQSIKQLLTGKKGLVRGAMMGHRVDYTSRTVIGPAPHVTFNQVAVPKLFAPTLTIKERVTQFSLDYYRALYDAGKITHIVPSTGKFKGFSIVVGDCNRNKIIIQIGDEVSRHLQNGDYLLFNRQPTLHKQGVLGMEVVLEDRLNFGLHPSHTSPLGADYDGDEGNGHIVQTLGARSEAATLLHVKYCIMSSQTNRPIIATIFDTLTGGYILTEEQTLVDRDTFSDCVTIMTSQEQLRSFPERARKHNITSFSGRALFSILLPEDFFYNYGGVLVVDGILLRGRISKTHIGATANAIIQVMYYSHGADRTASFITDTTWIINRWFTERGFSVGPADCFPDKPEEVKILLKKKIKEQELLISALGPPLKDPLQEERRKNDVVGILNSIRSIGGEIGNERLPKVNSFRIMRDSGAKGNDSNIGQITGMVGQQFLWGQPIKPSLTGNTRCLPYFDPNSDDLKAYGMCEESYLEGLSPAAFFFTQVAGREGLINTGLKTSETGAQQRRLTKFTEDFTLSYDGTVRNSAGALYSFYYGGDNMDGSQLSVLNNKADNTRYPYFIDVRHEADRINASFGYLPK